MPNEVDISSVINDEYTEMYREMHKSGFTRIDDEGEITKVDRSLAFPGQSIVEHIDSIKELCTKHRVKTVLDYGCGKAKIYQPDYLHRCRPVKRVWRVDSISLYDPAVAEYCEVPKEPVDMVICTDVLEHIPLKSLDTVVRHIGSLAKKCIFLNVHTGKAFARLPNGENAHCTIRDIDWWGKFIQERVDVPFYLLAE